MTLRDRTALGKVATVEEASREQGGRDVYGFVFGAFLGLCILKFGNPVILDAQVGVPASFHEAWSDPWPPRWGFWILGLLLAWGAGLAFRRRSGWRCTRWLWILPVVWLGWQFVAAAQTVDGSLTRLALFQFGGCVACYGCGALLMGNQRCLRWLLIGLLSAFALCLVRAVNQRLSEFPQERRFLLEGERSGWTNVAPEVLAGLRRDQTVVTVRGVEVVNPAILAKLAKGRVHGTLAYPNALAGAVVLLWPVSIMAAWAFTRRFSKPTRGMVVALALALGFAAFVWSGSKFAWLIAMLLASAALLRPAWPARLRWALMLGVVVCGLAAFAIRFHGYFAGGAPSAGARLDYWRVAVKIASGNPWLGSGPGTFQESYARLKPAAAEMTRLVHNDYLEQFSDSGWIGGVSYLGWILVSLMWVGRRVWREGDAVAFSVFLGVCGWFMQGLGEFGLYIPALAWPAFTLLGCLVGLGMRR
jgi:O-antigen ligase